MSDKVNKNNETTDPTSESGLNLLSLATKILEQQQEEELKKGTSMFRSYIRLFKYVTRDMTIYCMESSEQDANDLFLSRFAPQPPNHSTTHEEYNTLLAIKRNEYINIPVLPNEYNTYRYVAECTVVIVGAGLKTHIKRVLQTSGTTGGAIQWSVEQMKNQVKHTLTRHASVYRGKERRHIVNLEWNRLDVTRITEGHGTSIAVYRHEN